MVDCKANIDTFVLNRSGVTNECEYATDGQTDKRTDRQAFS